LTFLLTPFIIHRLGGTAFGIWILLHTIFYHFHLIEWGIIPAVVHYISRHEARDQATEIESVIATAMVLLSLFSLISIPFTYLLVKIAPYISDSLMSEQLNYARIISVFGVNTILKYFSRLLEAIFKGYQRYDLLGATLIPVQLFGAALKVSLLLQGYGLLALSFSLVLHTIVEIIVLFCVLRKVLQIHIQPLTFRKDKIREILTFSHYAFLNDIAYRIAYHIDTVVIATFLPVKAITYYCVGTRISGVLEKIANPLTDIFFPMASELEAHKRPEQLHTLLIEGSRSAVLLITSGLIILSFYARDVIQW
jgi:O-antigen/teichoic acid export membrane protein